MSNGTRGPDGRFAEQSFTAVYDALAREIRRTDENLSQEIGRINDLRQADQISLVAALTAAKTAVDAALAAAEKAVAAALIAAKEAVNKAEAAQQRTNEGQNEFRAQLKDQASTFLTRNEYTLSHKGLEDKVDGIAKDVGILRSRIDVGPPSLSILQQRSDEESGRKKGSDSTLATIIAVASAAAVIGGAVGGIILNAMAK